MRMLRNIDFNPPAFDDISVRPALSRHQELFLLFSHSGQIEPSAWEQHLREEPVLAAYCKAYLPRKPLQ